MTDAVRIAVIFFLIEISPFKCGVSIFLDQDYFGVLLATRMVPGTFPAEQS
jgi:hypothetical protein